MKDRQPTPGMEGRVLITPEDTSIAPFYARLSMADNALDDGTPMIAATFLNDATAALYGHDPNATVDNILALLGIYAQYWWRARSIGGYYQEVLSDPEDAVIHYGPGSNSYTLWYSSSLEIDQSTGAVSLFNPIEIKVSYDNDISSLVAGKYINTSSYPDDIYYVGNETSFESWTSDKIYRSTLTNCSLVSSEYVSTNSDYYYLRSSDRNAYPDSGTVDNVEYQFLGKPLDNAVGAPKIETGSYIGTGYNLGSGASSVTLNFQHIPFVVFISTTNPGPQTQALVRGSTYASGDKTENGAIETTLVWGEKSLTITNNYYGAHRCFNESGKTYYYYAMYISG